jgi:anaerobic glycerol-3-phosphate dehydrogenase C subunit
MTEDSVNIEKILKSRIEITRIFNLIPWVKIKRKFKGNVMEDNISRYLFSTDASLYKVKPLAVVQPKNEKDVQQVVKFCAENRIPIHARGAGSGVAGQALGAGIVIDFTRYMNKIYEINPEEDYFICGPGLKGATLQRQLDVYNKYIPPDPSSFEYATIGGMIATNASGAHSVMHGDFDKWVDQLEVVLPNGELITVKDYEMDSEEFKAIIKADTAEAAIYKKLIHIWKTKRDLVFESYPHIPHNNTGYELRNTIKDGKISLLRLIAGSEGTLGLITKVKMKIATKPTHKVLALALFDDHKKAGKSIKFILEQQKAAIEMLGKKLLSMTRERYPSIDAKLPKELDTMLLIEFEGEDLEELKQMAAITKDKLVNKEKLAFSYRASDDPKEQEELWEARKSAVPLLYKIKGERKIIALFEDAVVPTDYLGDYLADLQQACDDLEIELIAYGHAGKGLLHNRPLINMKDAEDIRKMETLGEKSFELVQKYGGAVSGEHSDGRVRARFIRRQYGDEFFELLHEVRSTFDPYRIFNPDNKITDNENVMMENFRYGADYSTIQPDTLLSWEEDEFNTTIETCFGCGKCGMGTTHLVMCPVYKGKSEEYVLPRAKNNMMRGYLEGEYDYNELMNHELFEHVIYNCIGCQNCAFECPSEVDTGRVMAEMKSQYMDYHRPKLWHFLPRSLNPRIAYKKFRRSAHLTHQYIRNKTLANIGFIGKMASIFAPISGWATSFIGVRLGMDVAVGISYKRKMPKFTNKTFLKWWKQHKKSDEYLKEGKKKVVYYHGCSANRITPDVGIATVELMEKLGVSVDVCDQQCCGSPAFSYGVKDVFSKYAKFNVNELDKYVKDGYDIITSCTSCALALKVEFEEMTDDPRTEKIAEHTFLTTEYVSKLIEEGEVEVDFGAINANIAYHTSCHLRAQRDITTVSYDLLQKIPDLETEKVVDTCCGISGSWGMKKENYDASMKIGEPMFDTVNQENIDFALTDCPTCAMQIEHGTKKDVSHPVVLLNKSIETK